MTNEKSIKKVNLGCGRKKLDGYLNIDRIDYIDRNGDSRVDLVMNIEEKRLPFPDNSLDEIMVDNVLEHIGDGLIHVLNECHRTLRADTGILVGIVPVAGTDKDFRDITHKRHFTKSSFIYLTGENQAMDNRPKHPKYADYEVLPWKEIEIKEENDLIYFKLTPNKKFIRR